MLISEKYLEIEHIFAHALKTEVSRLDNSRMDRPDGDLMSSGAFQRHNLFRIDISAKRIKLRISFIG
jgi:hypothetical protein